MDFSVPFASEDYFLMLALLAFSRGMDFLSTWIATPRLLLEGNPVVRWLGWKWSAVVNLILVAVLPIWPLLTVAVSTTSLLVAARNFQSAWLMRSMGEAAYRDWHVQRLKEAPLPLFLLCLAGNTLPVGGIGAALIYFSGGWLMPIAIGMGVVAYAVAVLFYTSLSLWWNRRRRRYAITRD